MKSSHSAPVISLNKLEQAFDTFNAVSAELDSSYRKLEVRVTELNEALAASNSARVRELTEKEKLAAKLSALMDALPVAVITLDSSNSVREENPQAIEILGQSSIGCQFEDILRIRSSGSATYEGEVSLQNGKRIAISSSQWGQEGARIIVITDVSENHRLNELVNREEKLSALGEMAARLAHQIRTPLSAAILYLSHLSAATNVPKQNSAAVTNIRSRLRQIEKLIEGMLSYLRGEIGTTESFSPAQLLVEVEAATSMQVEAAGGVLTVDVGTCEEFVQGNREAIFNALSNLVENAIVCAEDAPFIRLTVNSDAGSVIFTVTDNGPGVDNSLKENIFEPFYSTRPEGTGLGLAVVASVARAHGGEVVVADAESGGASFKIRIPVRQQNLAQESDIWACGLG